MVASVVLGSVAGSSGALPAPCPEARRPLSQAGGARRDSPRRWALFCGAVALSMDGGDWLATTPGEPTHDTPLSVRRGPPSCAFGRRRGVGKVGPEKTARLPPHPWARLF